MARHRQVVDFGLNSRFIHAYIDVCSESLNRQRRQLRSSIVFNPILDSVASDAGKFLVIFASCVLINRLDCDLLETAG